MNDYNQNTKPNSIPSNNEPEGGLGKTQQTSIDHNQDDSASHLDKTMPTPVDDIQDLSGFSDTTFTPINQTDDPQGMDDQKPETKRKDTKKHSWLIRGIIGIIVLLIIAITSAFAGYGSGISLRRNAERTQVAIVAAEQFQLGVQELGEGQFLRARQRFEYVIQLNPNYPGVTDKLAEVLLELNTTATPTLVPTPTLTPTPDLRDVQELYDQSKQYIANREWSNAIDALLMLRKTDAEFQKVDVDGMLFLALRNRGAQKITGEADLEGGIYDLSLASRFGPMDTEAEALLNWSTMYITGASFWDIDWEQVLYYFEQVAPQMPHLSDQSGWTATERYRIALFEYGNVLARQGKYCKAVQYYQQSLAYSPDPQVQEALMVAEKGCNQNSGENQTPEAEN